jgi:hypothetical protein
MQKNKWKVVPWNSTSWEMASGFLWDWEFFSWTGKEIWGNLSMSFTSIEKSRVYSIQNSQSLSFSLSKDEFGALFNWVGDFDLKVFFFFKVQSERQNFAPGKKYALQCYSFFLYFISFFDKVCYTLDSPL